MKKILIALIAVLSLGNLVAQETTSNVRGTVTDGAGNAVANAVVTVTSSLTLPCAYIPSVNDIFNCIIIIEKYIFTSLNNHAFSGSKPPHTTSE